MPSDRIQIGVEAVLRRFHQGTMERRANREHSRLFGAAFFSKFCRSLNRRSIPGDHDLLRRIDICGFTNLPLSSITANIGNFVRFHSQDCCHGTNPNRDGFLHVLAAIAHSANRIGKAESAGRDVCGIFP